MKIYFIGGSPCSGKSTVAQALTEQYHLTYFQVDHRLEAYIARGAREERPVCTHYAHMDAEHWMREPTIQYADEWSYYEEVFDYVLEDLEALGAGPILTEGAAYLPGLMARHGVPPERYLCLTPTRDFQLTHYRQRPWICQVLKDCRDPETAFLRWMERDALFGERAAREAAALGYCSIINDGKQDAEALTARIAAHFGFAGTGRG